MIGDPTSAIDAGFDERVVPVDLHTNDDSGLIACAKKMPRLSWRLSAERRNVRQHAYHLQVADNPHFATGTIVSPGVETGNELFAPWPAAPLRSREQRWCRVRVRTDMGWTAWSESSRIEGSLFEASDWLARPISPLSNAGRVERSAPCLLRRDFNAADFVSARLYVSALGVYEVTLNGETISDDLLEPGWTDYRQRTLFSTYDVLPLLRDGMNCIAAEVADGWWRGELGWLGRRGIYGDTTAFLAQLEMVSCTGERTVIATDANWRGGYGAAKLAELYDGIDVDLGDEPDGWRLAGFDDSTWEAVAILDLPPGLEQRAMPAIKVLRTFEPLRVRRSAHVVKVDAGQNLVGYLSLRATGPAGAKVTIRHAEVLDEAGCLHVAPLRNARATDTYRLRGTGDELLVPRHTFHGFRFAEIVLDPGVEISRVEVVWIGTNLDYSGRFECSNADLNQIFANTVASQKGNFVSLPTDCPQRDERLGWTGDIQVFCETACFNANARSFLANWLTDLSTEQRADGNVPSTVPNIIQGHEFEFGGVGWGDAATLVPWTLYSMYGDLGVLAEQYPSMKAWVDYCTSRLGNQHVWVGDFHLGDWLDPGAPPEQPFNATTDSDFLASCYLSYSARRLADAAWTLERWEEFKFYTRLSRQVAGATWRRWRDLALTTQTGCAIAIMFGIAPDEALAEAGVRLAGLVEANGFRIATGFLGTPLVLPALSRTGQTQTAYRLLFNRACPGWLYQVDRGATTMWERWDAVRADGSLHPGAMDTGEANSMTSFNHYAYGAVSAWLYRTVAGLAPDARRPGFGHILFAPELGGDLTWAGAQVATGFGEASIRWSLDEQELSIELLIPAGATATFKCPDGWSLPELAGERELGSGEHHFRLQARAPGRRPIMGEAPHPAQAQSS